MSEKLTRLQVRLRDSERVRKTRLKLFLLEVRLNDSALFAAAQETVKEWNLAEGRPAFIAGGRPQ